MDGTERRIIWGKKNCRVTFKNGDVPAHLIKQTAGLRWAGMWVRENRKKALSADCGFSNPEGANSARSANRVLNEVVISYIVSP